MNDIIPSMQWRYATKKYNPEKKVSEADFSVLLEAVRLAPSSFGLVTWKMIIVTDPALRTKLREAGYGQPQLTDASHLVIFAVATSIDDATVDAYAHDIAQDRGVADEVFAGLATSVKGALAAKSPEARVEWAARQAYIALGVLLETAALMRIDATPMEGFDTAKFDAILGLQEKGLATKVMAAVGYRDEADTYATQKKFRPSNESLIIKM